MEKKETTEKITQLVAAVRHARMENITHTRTHAHHVFLLSGAISAFLMSVYASTTLTSLQHAFVSVALACFLLSILLGVCNLSYVLHRESRSLGELQDALERRDTDILTRREEEDRRRDKISKFDILGTMIDVLFAGGVLLLLAMIAVAVRHS